MCLNVFSTNIAISILGIGLFPFYTSGKFLLSILFCNKPPSQSDCMESIWDSKFLNLVVDSQMLLGLDNIDANKGQRDEADNFNCKNDDEIPGFRLCVASTVSSDGGQIDGHESLSNGFVERQQGLACHLNRLIFLETHESPHLVLNNVSMREQLISSLGPLAKCVPTECYG